MSSQIRESGLAFAKDCLLGTAGSAVSLSVGYGALKGSHSLMDGLRIPVPDNPTYFSYLGSFSQIQNGAIRSALKVITVVYITAIIPIIESWFFHHMIYSWQETKSEEFLVRSYRVLTNALIFGAFHYSIFAGWANVPVLVVTTIAGIVFAVLRELTGNVRATTIAHMINNCVVMLAT